MTVKCSTTANPTVNINISELTAKNGTAIGDQREAASVPSPARLITPNVTIPTSKHAIMTLDIFLIVASDIMNSASSILVFRETCPRN